MIKYILIPVIILLFQHSAHAAICGELYEGGTTGELDHDFANGQPTCVQYNIQCRRLDQREICVYSCKNCLGTGGTLTSSNLTDTGCTFNYNYCKCNNGEYYNNGSTKCTACPTNSETSATPSSSNGAASISDCYIAAGNTFSDSKGSGTYTSNCKY